MIARIKSSFTDLFLLIAIVLTLSAIIYLLPRQSFNLLNLGIAFVILIPTLKALVYGAPFVPTPMAAVKKILASAKIKKNEKVYDIGCGDGRMVYLAAKDYNAEAVGFELSPLVYALARIRHFFWQSKAKILFRDFKFYNFENADVIVCYLLPETLARLQTKLDLELKKGTRVVSYAFPVGNWKPSSKIERNTHENLAPIWIYEK